MAWRPRDVHIFRPYPDEVPWELLAAGGAPEEILAEAIEPDLVRVAKLGERTVGAYAILPVTPVRFRLLALAVADGFRRRGLGRWLAGHAIGLAESKGAREILAPAAGGRDPAARRFLEKLGFAPWEGELRLELEPE